jgi:hypothetical protein
MEGDLVKGTLLPLLGLREPKCLAFAIKRCALTAQEFLATNLDEPIHDLHSTVRSQFLPAMLAEPTRVCLNLMCAEMGQVMSRTSVDTATQHALND